MTPAPVEPSSRRLRRLLAALGGVVLVLFGTAAVVAEPPGYEPPSIWLARDFQDGDHPFFGPTGDAVATHLRIRVLGPGLRDRIVHIEPASEFDRRFADARKWMQTTFGRRPKRVGRYTWSPTTSTVLCPRGHRVEWWRDDARDEHLLLELERMEAAAGSVRSELDDPVTWTSGWPSRDLPSLDVDLPRLRATILRPAAMATLLAPDHPGLPARFRRIEAMRAIAPGRLRED
jgi:hypothetical protein